MFPTNNYPSHCRGTADMRVSPPERTNEDAKEHRSQCSWGTPARVTCAPNPRGGSNCEPRMKAELHLTALVCFGVAPGSWGGDTPAPGGNLAPCSAPRAGHLLSPGCVWQGKHQNPHTQQKGKRPCPRCRAPIRLFTPDSRHRHSWLIHCPLPSRVTLGDRAGRGGLGSRLP